MCLWRVAQNMGMLGKAGCCDAAGGLARAEAARRALLAPAAGHRRRLVLLVRALPATRLACGCQDILCVTAHLWRLVCALCMCCLLCAEGGLGKALMKDIRSLLPLVPRHLCSAQPP